MPASNDIKYMICGILISAFPFPANKENIDEAIEVINNQQGGGGTELLPAVKRALRLPYDENTSRSILIITDGYISAERNVFYLIDKKS